MADTAASPQAPAVTGTAHAKKTSGGQKKSKNPRAKPNHPPTSEMVNNAIKNLKERGGSSLQAIKKYISANYKVDAEKLSPFIKKYLKAAVASGGLVQTKGKGASGSFKLSSGSSVAKPASGGGGSEKSPSSKPKAGAKKSAGAAAKAKTPTKKPHAAGKAKAVSEKKTVAAKARKAPSEKKSAKAPKSPSKAKRSNKGPTKKPKAPKPKRTKPTGGSSPSKAASKKVAASSGTPVKKK